MSDEGQPAYLYYFTYVGRDPFAALGAFHSEELMFIGDTSWKSWTPNSDDEKLSEMMEDYWVKFAKSGNPNRRGLPEWPLYKKKRAVYGTWARSKIPFDSAQERIRCL
jgi:para-nitrobenzyl esterase